MKTTDVLIIGGGPAGLTAALDLAKRGKQVMVVEKKTYPRHKVCGEYVSNEVKPYLDWLGVDFNQMLLPKIDTLQISTKKGRQATIELPLGGFGISRYALDHSLYQTAKKKGVIFSFNAVTEIEFLGDMFEVVLNTGAKISSKVVLGAFGKRSNLDVKLLRRSREERSSWLAVKCHYDFDDHPDNVVALHNFPGGYAGLSKVEGGTVNLCYLAKYSTFKSIGDINSFNQLILGQNRFLADFLTKAKPKFENPLSIGQISFKRKTAVDNHVLMCGDTAGMIHPLCGNGMAMAIHASKMASGYVDKYLSDSSFSKNDMELGYRLDWKRHFNKRIWVGKQLQSLMMHTGWFNLGMYAATSSNLLLESVVRRTHGRPILS